MSKSNQKTKAHSSKGKEGLSPMEIVEISGQAIEAIDNITNLIQKIGEERRKTAEIKLEQQRISSELEAQISATENETKRILGQYQIELSKIASETRLAEIAVQKEIAEGKNTHEERMRRIETDHERRMRHLDLIEKIIDATLRQYNDYSSYINITSSVNGAAPIINYQMLDAMNSAVLRLNDTLSRANLDAPIP